MSKRHGAREQQRLAKKKAKRKARRRQLAHRDSPDPTVLLKATDRWPITATLVPDNLWTTGIGNLVIARHTPDGRLACGIFLLDVFCLGVKDACWKILSKGEFKEIRRRIEEQGRLEDMPPEYFAKLVYRAVDHAQSLGFSPHSDFRHAQRLLAGIDPSLCPDEFEFGQNGQAHYIAGPSESMSKARAISRQVEAQGGYYTLPLDDAELADLEIVDEWDDDFDIDESDEDDCVDEKLGAAEPGPLEEPNQNRPRLWWLPWR
jgi:hypothetical protein